MSKRFSASLSIAALLIATSACRPFIAIGWPELIILVILSAIFMGPLMFRLYRMFDKIQKADKAKKKKKN